MDRDSNKLFPKYDDFADLDVAWGDDVSKHQPWVVTVCRLLQGRSTRGVIAIVTLVVLGIGFLTNEDIWGLFAVDCLIVVFSTIAILVGPTDAKRKAKNANRADESGNESDGSFEARSTE